MGMNEMLEYLMQNSDEQFQRQIQYILNQLISEQEEEREENEVEDEEDDEDYGDENDDGGDNEVDGEYNDTIKFEGVLIGEDLLTSQFVLPTDQAMTQTITISKKIEVMKENKLNHSAISDRPTTGIYAPDNPFNLSRMGYANPSADRNLPSAMKSRPKI